MGYKSAEAKIIFIQSQHVVKIGVEKRIKTTGMGNTKRYQKNIIVSTAGALVVITV